jgi:hypothetical protein
MVRWKIISLISGEVFVTGKPVLAYLSGSIWLTMTGDNPFRTRWQTSVQCKRQHQELFCFTNLKFF